MATKTITRYRTRTVKARRRGRAGFTVPLGIVGGFAPLLYGMYTGFQRGGFADAATEATFRLTGYHLMEKRFSQQMLVQGWTPIILGFVLHKLAGKFGINRALAQAGVPIIRI